MRKNGERWGKAERVKEKLKVQVKQVWAQDIVINVLAELNLFLSSIFDLTASPHHNILCPMKQFDEKP